MSGGSGYAGRVAIDGAASSAGPLPSGAATEATTVSGTAACDVSFNWQEK